MIAIKATKIWQLIRTVTRLINRFVFLLGFLIAFAPIVRDVETTPLKDKPGSASHQAFELPRTLWALGQRLGRDGLEDLMQRVALVALVFVGGHGS